MSMDPAPNYPSQLDSCRLRFSALLSLFTLSNSAPVENQHMAPWRACFDSIRKGKLSCGPTAATITPATVWIRSARSHLLTVCPFEALD